MITLNCFNSLQNTHKNLSPQSNKNGKFNFQRRNLISSLVFLIAKPIKAEENIQNTQQNQNLDQSYLELINQIDQLTQQLTEVYANREFQKAADILSKLIDLQPSSPKWREYRATVLVDGKNFDAAINDYDSAIKLVDQSLFPIDSARLLAGRGLANEGLGLWEKALDDYQQARQLAQIGGQSEDPYVLNSIGNVNASLGNYNAARQFYLDSANVFQKAKGFKGRGGSQTMRLDGAIYAQSNAALMAVQIGDEDQALKEMEYITRRAPGSVDIRAGLAALYWSRGRREEAEELWNFACENITTGCSKYQDVDWLQRIRRWPPVMVDKLQNFLKIQQ